MANRDNVYYWKCDRPDAFYAIGKSAEDPELKEMVKAMISELFGEDSTVESAGGQGNHKVFTVQIKDKSLFVRVENGRDCDNYMGIESEIIKEVGKAGVPTPKMYYVDSSRKEWPFAYQIMENVPFEDLNRLNRKGELDLRIIMTALGRYIALWQSLNYDGFGPFNAELYESGHRLKGLHKAYKEYYYLNLDKHLEFLEINDFLRKDECLRIRNLIDENSSLLEIERGCLVHKDIALWNILGTKDRITAVIDWDDSICGDPTDDISLMGCYHTGDELERLMEGYESVKRLPADFEKRFWLHLLRNMIFKAVIRVGGDYFNRGGDFFLSEDGSKLRETTLNRLNVAIEGLEGRRHPQEL